MMSVSASVSHFNRSTPNPDYDRQNHNLCMSASDGPIVIINISGKRFQTYEETLARFPKTLLGNPTRRQQYYNEETGEYFFDRHRASFSGILYYYQSNGTLERPHHVSESIFTKEVLFFELGDDVLGLDEEGDTGVQDELPSNKILRTIWVLFEMPQSSIMGKILAVISVVVILLSIVVFCLETIPELDPNRIENKARKQKVALTWTLMNTICNAWFTIEYVLRLISSPNKMKFLKYSLNVIDLISIIPFYVTLAMDEEGNSIEILRVVRVIRVVRIFKLTRHSRGLHILGNTISASFHELIMLVLFLAIGVILFSSSVYYAESNVKGTDFRSIPHSFWWAVVTMTTVGYGDVYPTTLGGKLVGTMCAISGVLVIALPVPVIVSNFEHYYKEEKDRQARIEERQRKLANSQRKLSPLKEGLKMLQSGVSFKRTNSAKTNGNDENLTLVERVRKLSQLVNFSREHGHEVTPCNSEVGSDSEGSEEAEEITENCKASVDKVSCSSSHETRI